MCLSKCNVRRSLRIGASGQVGGALVVGLCTLNQVDP
jgi:hypothetical protein